MISIIVPTLNEGKNLKELIEKIGNVFNSVNDYEILIVDKFSQDNTKQLFKELSAAYPVKLFQRNLDLSNSVVYGISKARGEIIGVIDGDLSHPPERIPDFIAAIKEKACDLVIGTRKHGGVVQNWPLHRKIISRLGELIARPLARGCSDPMSGFFFFQRSVIRGIQLQPIGYKILLEILTRGRYQNYYELPYVFRNRKQGSSKLNVKEYLKYLRHVMRLYLYKVKLVSRGLGRFNYKIYHR